MSECVFLYRFNSHYAVIEDGVVSIKEINIDGLKIGGLYKGESLNFMFGLSLKSYRKYLFYGYDDKYMFHKVTFNVFTRFFLLSKTEYFKSKIDSAINKFKSDKKESLLSGISTPGISLSDFLNSIAEYIFCENYSLWSYNSATKVYTCETSSIGGVGKYIDVDSKCGFNNIVDDKTCFFECREPSNEYNRFDLLDNNGVGSIIRIRVDVGYNYETLVVVNFYSSMRGVDVKERLAVRVRELVRMKYLERIQIAEEQFKHFSHESSSAFYDQTLHEYLRYFCKQICDSFRFEAASVLLASDNDPNKLTLIATNDIEGDRLVNNVEYDLSVKSLTKTVFTTRKNYCSYDLDKEEDNSHYYDESTKFTPKNWVGMPIILHDEVVGVFRVKNKYISYAGKEEVRPPSSIHLYNLSRARELLVSAIGVYKEYDYLNKKYKDNENYYKVLMHEIRTPISSFDTTPDVIINRLRQEGLSKKSFLYYKNKLKDLQVLGGRLGMIAQSYNIDSLLTTAQTDALGIQREIIYPVINISIPYHKKMNDCIFEVDHSSFHSYQVFGDADLYMVVLNALIDNAAKYCSENNRIIKIWGSNDFDENKMYLNVSNIGLPIMTHELDRIFENGYRGASAREERLDGTGIGLYVSRRIMREFDGDLTLDYNGKSHEFVFTISFQKP